MLNFPGCLARSGADMSVLQRQQLTLLHPLQPNFTHFHLLNNFSNEFGSASASPATSSLDMDHSTFSTTTMKEELVLPADEMPQCTNGGNTFKKRRPESDVVEESRDKRRNRGVVEEDHHSPNENSKIPEKPDYVHVRARRGQATDSHSLAERARREKINKKMKSLQELVPGCNKPTGKAGMLDEIINYVQSLQRQVEFLSMKLAHVNPRLELSIDNIFTKEFPACVATTLSEMANLAYNQPNSLQPVATNCEMDTLMLLNPLQTGESRISISPVPQVQSFSPWETDLQNIYNGGFQ